jgi:hypothetical protein
MTLTFMVAALGPGVVSEDSGLVGRAADPPYRRTEPPKESEMTKTKTVRVAKSSVVVTIRRLGKPAGTGKQGEVVLVLDPKIFGSAGSNWLHGKSYSDKAAALAAAKAAGATVANA